MARESTLEQKVDEYTYIRGHPHYTTEKVDTKGVTYYLIAKYQPCCRSCGWVGIGWPDRKGAKSLAEAHKCS
jgi:hypothetical protein